MENDYMLEDNPVPQGRNQNLIRHATLRQIQIFEAVARNLSFTKAADELFLTQPTVSAQIKSFSKAIDMPLYEQVGRAIHLTDVGVMVARACREVINQLANLEICLDDFRDMRRGHLRIAVVTTAKYFAPVALGEFSMKYPQIDLSLKVTNREEIYKRIEENLDDLYILGQAPPSYLELEIVPFAPNPLVVIAHQDHPLVGEKNIPLSRLAEEPILMREHGSGIRSAIESLFMENGLKVKERMVLESNEALKHAVYGRLGVSVVSLHALNLESEDSPLAILDVEGFPIRKQWNIVYPRRKSLSMIAEEFLQFLIEKGNSYFRLNENFNEISRK